MKTPPTGQLDMFAEAEREAYEALPIICLYNSTARGLDARAAEVEATPRHVHAWSVAICVPKERTIRCQATVLTANTRKRHNETAPCGCDDIDELVYRGACLKPGCDFDGDPHPRDENAAVEDAMDHAWPGWRDVPIVSSPPFDGNAKANEKWLAKVIPLYPEGWIENGGPVRTQRSKYGTRHHGPATPSGGYDMGVPAPETEDK